MNTGYVVRFVLTMTVVVALILAGLYSLLKDIHEKNELIFEKRAILAAVNPYLDKKVDELADEEVEMVFNNKVKSLAINNEGEVIDDVVVEDIDMAKEKKKADEDRLWPVYIYDTPEGKIYIVSVRGNGLWDEIWGNIALKDDFNTIAGAAFDHKGETPGLGAEIKDNPSFPKQFREKKLYTESGEFKSVTVRKGKAQEGDMYGVDGVSGATITMDGVTDMLKAGIAYYEPYFEKLKKEAQTGMLVK